MTPQNSFRQVQQERAVRQRPTMNTRCTYEKRHSCPSTAERQLTVGRERVATWRHLRGLLYSHSDTRVY
jgi:hypothetical protein